MQIVAIIALIHPQIELTAKHKIDRVVFVHALTADPIAIVPMIERADRIFVCEIRHLSHPLSLIKLRSLSGIILVVDISA